MNDNPTTTRTVEEIEEELRAAKARDAADKKALAKATPILMRYEIGVSARHLFDRIYDNQVCLYTIRGICVNLDTATAAGHNVRTGAMDYLFNKATGKIIMSYGGGYVYVDGGFGNRNNPISVATFDEINAFLAVNPEGGDITKIVVRYKAALAVAEATKRVNR